MKKCLPAFLILAQLTGFSQAEHVVEIDRNTGNFKKISNPIPNVTAINENVRTYDRVHGAYYFQATTGCSCMVSTDVTTGDLLYQHQMPLLSFQYDNANSKLFGIRYFENSGVRQFGEIDTAIGAFTQIGNDIAVPFMSFHNWSTYDAVQKLYFIENSPSNWLTLSAVSGGVLANQTLLLVPNESIVSPCFNELDSTNYCLVYNSVFQKMWLAKFEAGTGTVTKLGNGKLYYFGNNGSATIDPVRKQFLHLSRIGSIFYINSFDLVSGNYIGTSDLKPIESNEDFYNLEYDKTRDKLLAVHWSKSLDYVGVSESQQHDIEIRRNQEGTRYELLGAAAISSIEITDIMGRSVSTAANLLNGTWIIEKGNLNAGMYCIRCKQGALVVSTSKLLFN